MLKQLSIFLLALTFSQSSFGQNGDHSLYLKGLELSMAKKYDSALKVFYDIYRKSGYKYYSMALGNIADIELKMGNIDTADSLYRMCLKDTSEDSEYEKYLSALNLADICISRRKFNEALFYLDDSQTYKPGVFCSTGSFDRKFKLEWKYSICLSEIGNVDSAINCLTPFMFKGPEFVGYKEKLYNTINNHYYYLLLKKYDACQLQEMVNQSIRNVNYSEAADTTSYFAKHGNTLLAIECSIYFMGKTVWLLNVGVGGLSGQELKNPYSKDYCIRNIKRSDLYRIIMQ